MYTARWKDFLRETFVCQSLSLSLSLFATHVVVVVLFYLSPVIIEFLSRGSTTGPCWICECWFGCCSKEGTTATFTSSFEGASRIREAATSLQWPANMVDCCAPAICTWSVVPPIVCGHEHDTKPYSIWYLWENHSCRSLYTQDSNFWRLDFGRPKISKFASSCVDTQIATNCYCRGKERESCATTTTVCHHHHLSFRGQEKVAIWRKTIRGQSTSCRVPNGKGWKESFGSNHITAWIHCSFWWRSSGWIPQLPSAWLPGTRRCLGEGSTWLPFKCVETALASPWHVDFSLYCKRWAAAFRPKFSCMTFCFWKTLMLMRIL